MKKPLVVLFMATAFLSSAHAEDGTHRDRAEDLKSRGLYEEAVAEYKRALAEQNLLPENGQGLRKESPLAEAIQRHRAEIAIRLASVEGR